MCSPRTDAHGRAQCEFSAPNVGYASQYDIVGRYLGDASRAPAEDRGVLRVEQGVGGGLQVPGGAEVELGLNEALEGRPGSLRARVRRVGTPVTQGQVWFTANGVPLGEAPVNGVGLAHLNWTPAPNQLTKFFLDRHVLPGQWVGNLQAWYVPTDGGALLPGVAVAEARVGRWDPCALVGQGGSARCSVEDATGISYRLAGIPMVTVYRDQFGTGGLNRGAPVELSVPAPPEQPINGDCDPMAMGVFDALSAVEFCRRTCDRLQYWALTPNGDLAVLVDRPADQRSCDWPLSRTFDVPAAALRSGHDACAVRAAQLGITRWNHTASTSYDIPMLAVFRFRDPHLVRTSGGWRATMTWDSHIRYAKLRVTASVNCR